MDSNPPVLVAATITLGAGVSAAFVCEGKAAPFFMTIAAVPGLSSVTGWFVGEELEAFGEPFGSGSAIASEPSLLFAAVVSGSGDFSGAFGCKLVCGLGEDVFVDGGAMVADVTGWALLACAVAVDTGVVDRESVGLEVALA